MKKSILLAAFAALALTACQQDLTESVSQVDTSVFTATVEGSGTRTALSQNGNVYDIVWRSGDRITIVDGTQTPNVGVYETTGTGTRADFSLKSGSQATTPKFKAYYPDTLYNDGVPTLPFVQEYVEDNIAASPMYAESNTTSLIFKNLCGIIRINLSTEQEGRRVRTITLNAAQGMSGAITNAATLAADGYSAVVSDNHSVVLDCGEEGVAVGQTAVPFHIAVPAGTYTDFCVIVTTTDGYVQVRFAKVSIEVARSSITTLTLDFDQIGYIAVSSVQIDPENAELAPGESLLLNAIISPDNATDPKVTWSTDNASVATVTEAGEVTAVAPGTATITATAGEKSASCTVTVKPSSYEAERAALETFYKANNGDNWTRRDNWCTDVPLVEWYGVRMSRDEKHVVGLDLFNNNVIGYIPKEIGDLTELESLGISCTPEQTYGLPQSLFGPLPEEIGNLKKLTYLYLQDYPLTGTLPEGLFSLSGLETLAIIRSLYMDQASLSPSIGNLTGLKHLTLDDVNLTASLPSELGRLNNLTWINLDDNGFTGTVPSSYAGLVNIEHLGLKNNRLSGPLPATLANIRYYPQIWCHIVEFNSFSQEDLRSSKIPAPPSPEVKTLSGRDLDIEEFIKGNQYTVLFNVAPDFSDATEYLIKLENLYKKGKDKGLGVLTYFDNNSSDEQEISYRDNLFKDILNKSGAEWNSFIRYMYGDYPEGAPFYATYGEQMYPASRTNQIVIIGPDGTVDYTTLIDWDLKNDVEHALNYLEQVLDVSMTYYESQSYDRDGAVTQLQKATTGKGIDLVITGDAFSDRDMTNGTFEKAARQAMNDFFSVEPVKSLKERFNVYMVEAVSKNDEYFSGSSTAFSGVFGSGSAVGGDHGKVLEYAKKAVKDDDRMDNVFTLVLMNSYRDGGTCYMFDPVDEHAFAAGSSVAWVTYKDVTVSGGLSNLSSTVVHEAVGHGLGKLADEYAYLFMGEINTGEAEYIRKVQKWNWYMNIALTSTLSDLPWSRFIGDSAFASENIGAYQGGDTFWSGVWRPTEQSVMNDNYNHFTFNAPSRAQIYTRIMKLSEGQDWQFDYETFVKWDQAHPAKMSAAQATRSNYVEVDDAETEGHVPPVILNKTWRQLIHR